jgi:hypothetical protein
MEPVHKARVPAQGRDLVPAEKGTRREHREDRARAAVINKAVGDGVSHRSY